MKVIILGLKPLLYDDQFAQYQRNEKALKNLDKTNKAEMQDMDDDKNLYGPVSIKDKNGK